MSILKFLNWRLIFPYAFRAQIACYELEGDLSTVMLKEIFHDGFEKFKIYKGLYGNNANVTGWQKLFISCKCF